MEIEKFFAKKEEEVEVQGLKLKIPILTVKDLPIIKKMMKDSTIDVGVKELIFKVLKHNFPDVTMSDVEKLKIGFLNDLLNKIIEVNGLKP